MDTDGATLRDRLQSSLGSAYTIERELGGGGMSRVFVARDTALGRDVVVKVLPPELGAGVSLDRFMREIQVAARLQHPHIVPVLSAGESQGLPFYTMPFVEGDSLRARLGRGGLSTTEVVGILREVARALAYAHAHGVVHRDIKPDNVLLAGGSAVVTDFGIAKAVAAARAEGSASATLTQLGTSIGTPTYMAPEQAAGDPATDHRADLYAFGAMAYELLAGRPPFHGLPPHRLLAAHMSETPQPVTALRPETPPMLAELVMRCLEKDPNRRPQRAADVARLLETVTTSGAAQPAMPEALLGGRGMLRKALALYAAAFIVVAVLARAAIVAIGLPEWVLPGALIVMALGLPAILFTAFVHRQTHRALTATPQLTPGGTPTAPSTMATIAFKASPHVSWRRTAMGGVAAVGGFIVLVGAWMLLRALGIGPAGSLMAAGRMGERERVILADFTGSTADSLLPPTVTEAFRTDLAESTNLSVMPVNQVREVLRRMQRPADTPVDFPLAREIATREGIKAVVAGTVAELGGSYVLSARLVSAQTGEEMGTFRETADDEREIIPAIGRLSRKLRSRVGESLRTIQRAPALDQVSTSSLAALQKYVASNRALQIEGDFEKGRRLLEEAIALDTTFAMAYRRLAIEMANRGVAPARMKALLQKAYDHRDRLSDAERYLTLGSYYSFGATPDADRAVSAYESLLDIQPDHMVALNNLASLYQRRRDFVRAEALARRALAVDSNVAVYYNNLAWSQAAQGKLAAADSTARRFEAKLPLNPVHALTRSGLMWHRGARDSARALLDSLLRSRPNDLFVQGTGGFYAALTAAGRGRIADALRRLEAANDADARQGNAAAPLQSYIDRAELVAWFLDEPASAVATLERGLAAHPLDSLALAERPYDQLSRVFARAGRPDRARAYLEAFDRRRAEVGNETDALTRHQLLGHIAVAERRWEEAIGAYRASDQGRCTTCALPDLARAYDLAGNADSAIAVYARYVEGRSNPERLFVDGLQLAGAHRRLGELYETRGDAGRAATHYAEFIELWKDADPELQPLVRTARERLAALQRAERS